MKRILSVFMMVLAFLAIFGISFKEANASGENNYKLVTSVDELAEGDKIIIVAAKANVALGADRGNNRGAASITKKDDDTVTTTADVQEIVLGKSNGFWTLNVGDKYLYAADNGNDSSNHLKTYASLTDSGRWNITIASSGIATIKSNTAGRNWLRFNSGNNPQIFSCYKSGQEDVAIYKFADNYVDQVQELFDTFYNDGTYQKNTSINLTTDAQDELVKYFHDEVNILGRTTYYSGDELWMSKEEGLYSYYGSEGGLTYATTDKHSVTPSDAKVVIKGTSMEEHYTTLNDLKSATAVWKKDANGGYYTVDETIIKYYLDFTAPCFLNFNEENKNYFIFDKATVALVNNNLELKLYVTNTNSGALTSDELVLSQATIINPYAEEFAKAVEYVQTFNGTRITDDVQLETSYNNLTISWSGANVQNNVLNFVVNTSEDVEDSLVATISFDIFEVKVENIVYIHEKTEAGSGPVYADKTYSYTFTSKQWSGNGAKTLNSLSWTLAGTGGNYWGYDATKGQQFGSKSNPYTKMTLTSGSLTNVSKVEINTVGASGAAGTVTVTVGGVSIGSFSISTTQKTYPLETSELLSGPVVITYTLTTAKAIYIKSISIDYQVEVQ